MLTSLQNFTLHTGGAEGSDWFWEQLALQYRAKVNVYSFYGHKAKTTQVPIMVSPKQLPKATPILQQVNTWFEQHDAKRTFPSPNPYITKLLQRDYFIVHNADAVFGIAEINLYNNVVAGGTGWGVTVGILEKKPVYVYEYRLNKWYKYDYEKNCFVIFEGIPLLTSNFAGIGTRGDKVKRGEYTYSRQALEAILLVYKSALLTIG